MKRFFLIGTLVFCTAVGWMVAEVVRREYFEKKGSPSHLRRIATQINAREPEEDEVVELTATVANERLVLRYKLLDVSAADVDVTMQRKVRELARNHSCTNEPLRELLDNDVSLHYVMVDSEDKPLLNTEVLRWECGEVTTARSSR